CFHPRDFGLAVAICKSRRSGAIGSYGEDIGQSPSRVARFSVPSEWPRRRAHLQRPRLKKISPPIFSPQPNWTTLALQKSARGGTHARLRLRLQRLPEDL